jgi:MFS family permease
MTDIEEIAEEVEETEPVPSDEDEATSVSWFQAVRTLLSNKNFSIFILTAWIYSSLQVINRYFPLFLRDIGLTYIMVGVLVSLLTGISLIGEFVSGYLADNYDRRILASVTMAINAVGYFIIAYSGDIIMMALGFMMFGISSFTGKGGTAYIMEQMDRRHGGVGVSLFTLGTVFGLIPLFVVGVLLNFGVAFLGVMRTMFTFSGIAYMICALIRIRWLDSTQPRKRETKSDSVIRDFFSENIRSIKLLARVFPVFIAVFCIDALSDTFYGLANLYYVNETLGFGIGDINLMLLLTLTFSIPLTLYLGRLFDKHGGKKLTLMVYSVMPIAIGLLIVAQYIPYIAPTSWLEAADSVYSGLSVLFSLAFIATAIKSINDVLWMSVINTYIQKSLPRQDLGKMLSLTAVFVLSIVTFGQIPAGVIYELFRGLPLLFMALGLNFVILYILAARSIEPRVSVEELEEELGQGL